MAETLDCRGLKCPQPILKAQIKANSLPAGSSLEVLADCSTFPDDITKWCEKTGKVLVSIVDNGDHRVATIQL
ncbi:MAG: sulfurtransferase TusA family protein [Spartobacteria bacterium]|nr:sulfurtransferase TusA family protein [Spartobacteria bacterium]